MHPRIPLIIAATLVLVLCRTATTQASLIRDGNTKQFNLAVEAGGYPLPAKGQDNQLRVVIPYSLIGSLWASPAWFPPYIGWPWSVFSPFYGHRHDVIRRTIGTSRDSGLINRPGP
jgi:hypothetical protein